MKNLIKRVFILVRFLIENSRKKETPPFLIKNSFNIECKGKESYHNGNFTVKGNGILEVGGFCAIGSDVKVILSNHDVNKITMQYTFYRKYLDIDISSKKKTYTTVGNDVWIGDNCIILPGVTIGTGAVIGAGSIVTKNVSPYSIVAGNPAKFIRNRFSEEKIQELLNSQWWDWDEEKIKKNKSFFI